MSSIVERAPDPALGILLPGAGFADAFALAVPGTLDAGEASRRVMGRTPWWAARLMALRDSIVAPLGLKTSAQFGSMSDRVGFFPVVAADENRVVLGFPDEHLDFRVVVVTEPMRDETLITVTTLVRTHGWLGRVYLAFVKPFHRLIVPAMLRQAMTDADQRISV
jgi:hypothetical protein